MAGSIQRIIPNTLSYSCDFSSPFNSDQEDRLSAGFSDDVHCSVSDSSMLFDLRDGSETESFGNSIQLQELCAMSEGVLQLESSPGTRCVTEEKLGSPTDFKPIPDQIEVQPTTVTVSELVDSLVGPSLMPTLSRSTNRSNTSTKPSSLETSIVSSPKEADLKPRAVRSVPKVFPVTRTPPKKAAKQPTQTIKTSVTSSLQHPHSVYSDFVPFDRVVGSKNNPLSVPSFTCPDGWIPNHECDDFCFSTFASASKSRQQSLRTRSKFTPFPR